MWNIFILGVTSLLTDISSEMVYPLLPFFLTATLGATPAILGLVEGIAESTASLLKVFSGYLSDRIRRRKQLTMYGYAASAFGKVLLAVSGGWGTVLAGRVIDRVGKGVRTAPRDALIAESSTHRNRGMAFGLHRAMDTAGAAAGVLIAYLFLMHHEGDYAGVFFWSLIPALLGVAVLIGVRESRAQSSEPRSLPVFRWKALPRKLRSFLVIAALFTLGNSSNAFLLLRARDFGFTPQSVLLLYLVYTLSYAGCSYPAGRFSDRFGRKHVLVAGYLCYAGVYFFFAWLPAAGHGWELWVVFAVYGLYSGLTDGVEKALVTDLAPGELRATAIGLHATLVGIGLLPASMLAGQLWVIAGPEATFALGGTMGLAAAVGLLLLL